MTTPTGRREWRRLRLLVVATIIVPTVQDWTGDSVNLFVPFPTGMVDGTLNGLVQGIINTGLS